ncbi:MAG TPA: Fe-S-containing protein [Thermodesulfovibrionales bacterium]|jgi:uncharacterized membrane protein|nr:Fe-S-containing protein [Thermodesulfovibrionales bacterium]
MKRESPYDGKSVRWSLSVLLFVFSCLLFCIVSCSRQQPVYQEPFVRGTDIAIDVSTLGYEKPVFFTYHYRGKKINFFIFKTGDRVLSFLDACASCYTSRLGYRAEDGFITCRRCDVRYALSDIEKGFGSCSPIRLEGRLEAGKYLIPVSLLEKAVDKF